MDDFPTEINRYRTAKRLFKLYPDLEEGELDQRIDKLVKDGELEYGEHGHTTWTITTDSILKHEIKILWQREEARKKLEREDRKLIRELIAEFRELKKDIRALMRKGKANPGCKAPKRRSEKG